MPEVNKAMTIKEHEHRFLPGKNTGRPILTESSVADLSLTPTVIWLLGINCKNLGCDATLVHPQEEINDPEIGWKECQIEGEQAFIVDWSLIN
jgi:hypothetical protein